MRIDEKPSWRPNSFLTGLFLTVFLFANSALLQMLHADADPPGICDKVRCIDTCGPTFWSCAGTCKNNPANICIDCAGCNNFGPIFVKDCGCIATGGIGD